MKQFRASSVHKLITAPRTKSEVLSATAKSAIRDIAKQDIFGFTSFKGNNATEKGILLESQAIEHSGRVRNQFFTKHEGRLSNDYITGECDILTANMVIDTKCTWDIGTHPFFADEAMEKVKAAGYDIQMQCYMWLYDLDHAEIDFWLFPCPPNLIKPWDDDFALVDLVEQIDIDKRLTTVKIERDEAIIDRIKSVIPHCQAYYDVLCEQYQPMEI